MEVSAGLESNRDLNKVIDNLIKNTIDNVNGDPDIIILGITSTYKDVAKYRKAIERIYSEYTNVNVIGGTFPALGASGDYPTTIGASALAIKSKDITVSPPNAVQDIRVNLKQGVKHITNQYQQTKNESKIGIFFSPGPHFKPDAVDGMKVLDTKFAIYAKKLFNFIGRIIEKNMGKQGYGATNYVGNLIKILTEEEIQQLMGIATIDLSITRNFQFCNNNVFDNALVSTVLSSERIKFAQSWTFDKSKVKKSYSITDYLNSGYIQKINKHKAKEEFLRLLDIPEDIYAESFGRYNYASLLYLSAMKTGSDFNEYIPFVSACYPQLEGIISSLQTEFLDTREKEHEVTLFSQSGIGIKRSAIECASNLLNEIENPLFGLFFNCSNRLLIAGDKIADEVKAIGEVIGEETPFITLYGGGEFSIINKRPYCASASIHGMIATK